VTVPEAAQIVFRMMLPPGVTFGPLDDLIPCRVKVDGGKPVSVSRRKVIQLDGKWKSRRVFLPVDNITRVGWFQKLMGFIRSFIFEGVYANNIKYSLIYAKTAIENRPSTRETLWVQRHFAFQTGFIQRSYRGRKVLCVLLISEKSIRENAVLSSIKEIWEDLQRKRLRAEDLRLLEDFFAEVQSGSGLRFTKQELFSACRQVLQVIRKTTLRFRTFESQVWNRPVSADLRMPSKAGKQPSSRRHRAEAALKAATHKFLTTRGQSVILRD
jgi:hypothetical protein